MKRLAIIFGLIVIVHSKLYGQDTVVVYDRVEFEKIVNYAFVDYIASMNIGIKNQIDSVFNSYDFSREEYSCQYLVDFIITIDSCGFVTDCVASKNNKKNGDLKNFEEDVISIIKMSNWQIKNKISNQKYIFLDKKSTCSGSRIISFEISCEPREIIYFNYFTEGQDKINFVYYYESDVGPVYFNGFIYGCK